MKKQLSILLYFACVTLTSCNNITSDYTNNINYNAKIETNNENLSDLISKDSILKIAEINAKTAYNDLSIYNVKAVLKEEKWFIDYELSDPEMNGGGPHYVISAKTGEIISFRYEQ